MVLSFALLLWFGSREKSALAFDGVNRNHMPWLAFVLVGVLQTPLAIFAYTKLGAYFNSFSPSLFFLGLDAHFACLRIDGNGHTLVVLDELAVLFLVASSLQFPRDEVGHLIAGEDFEDLQVGARL